MQEERIKIYQKGGGKWIVEPIRNLNTFEQDSIHWVIFCFEDMLIEYI